MGSLPHRPRAGTFPKGSCELNKIKPPASPYEVGRNLDRITSKLTSRLRESYRLAYNLGYSRASGGGDGRDKYGHSDPTGDIAADKQAMRDRTARAARKIEHARKALDEADEILSTDTEGAAGPRRIYADELTRQANPGGPPMTTRSELLRRRRK